jgi:hypothetical protein
MIHPRESGGICYESCEFLSVIAYILVRIVRLYEAFCCKKIYYFSCHFKNMNALKRSVERKLVQILLL